MAVPLTFTDAAANKVKSLITEEENNELKLRVFVNGGGCSGFQYGFTLMKSKTTTILKSRKTACVLG